MDRQSDAMHEFEAAQVETKQTEHTDRTHTDGARTDGIRGRNTDEAFTVTRADLFTSFGSTPGACPSPVTCPSLVNQALLPY